MLAEKFKNLYRIPSARAQWHEYNGGMYFVTICTKEREHYFGEISNGKMNLTEIGRCLQDQINRTPQMRNDMNLEIPSFVIMPNHVHLIIVIGNNPFNGAGTTVIPHVRDAMHCVSNVEFTPNKFAPQSKNLASVIRGIKISTTTFARKHHIPFAWQPRFHDHIIRNNSEMNRIAKYIENNVVKWENNKNRQTTKKQYYANRITQNHCPRPDSGLRRQ